MTSMEIVNPRLDRFIQTLRANLGSPKNVSKGDWRSMSRAALMARLWDEVRELQSAVDNGHPQGDVIIEACDVAAFAFMLADAEMPR